MALELSNVTKLGEDEVSPSPAQRPDPKAERKGAPISLIRTKVSNLSDEEKNKLLFEVFDTLLQRHPQSDELSTGPDVRSGKNVG
jgi:hypothetical protein